jgi:bifunctional NMN adenylyltransferase/nudix hydrolase
VNDYPVAYQAVDVAVLRREDGVWQVLLGKRHVGATIWHLIGGISDPDDETLEYTGVRELYEESLVITDERDLQYVCSKKIRDWRYADGPDDIKTALYLTTNWRGQPTTTPEMVELQWFNVSDAPIVSGGNHVYLLQQLAEKVRRL